MTHITNISGTGLRTVRNYSESPVMSSPKSNRLIEVLKATLDHIESSGDWRQEDVAVVELKAILQRRIDQELSNNPHTELI